MSGTRIGKVAGVAGILIAFGGCQNVGPIAIDTGRDRYNTAIQSTAMEQTLANIIRVHKNQLTNFMDVTEVDTGTSLSGSLSGAVTNIGAIPGIKSTSAGTISGQVGNINSGVTYTEAPTVRYIPLVGNGLVQQLVTPVSTDALESLYNSSWKAGPLFDLSTVYQTFDFDYNAVAENLTFVLSLENWVSLVATKSQLTKTQDQTGGGSQGQSTSGTQANGTSGPQNQSKSGQVVTLQVESKPSSGNSGTSDALTIYLRPWDETFGQWESVGRLYFWVWLLEIYSGTQSEFTPATSPNFKPEDLKFCQSLGIYETSRQTSTESMHVKTEGDTTTRTTKTTNETQTTTRTTVEVFKHMPQSPTTSKPNDGDKTLPTTSKPDDSDKTLPTRSQTTTTTIPTSYQLHKPGLKRLLADLLRIGQKKAGLGENDRSYYLIKVRKCLPDAIELRTTSVQPGKAKGLTSIAPLLKTYSALGILKKGSGQNSPKFEFIDPETYRKISSYTWNKSGPNTRTFDSYIVLPCDEDEKLNPDHHEQDWNVGEWILIYEDFVRGQTGSSLAPFDRFLLTYAPVAYWPPRNLQEFKERDSKRQLLSDYCPHLSQDKHIHDWTTNFINGNIRLNELRRYILIITDNHRPSNAYVAHYDQGIWYYIDGDDTISQKNFELVSLFLTVMAVPGTTAPLTPTISVGGTGGGG